MQPYLWVSRDHIVPISLSRVQLTSQQISILIDINTMSPTLCWLHKSKNNITLNNPTTMMTPQTQECGIQLFTRSISRSLTSKMNCSPKCTPNNTLIIGTKHPFGGPNKIRTLFRNTTCQNHPHNTIPIHDNWFAKVATHKILRQFVIPLIIDPQFCF